MSERNRNLLKGSEDKKKKRFMTKEVRLWLKDVDFKLSSLKVGIEEPKPKGKRSWVEPQSL